MKFSKKKKSKLFGNAEKLRVIFSKSNRYLTVQAVDDYNQKTLIYISSRKFLKEDKKKNCKSNNTANIMGKEFAKILNEKNMKTIIFDRNGYPYHGKIKIFCDEMRKLGIIF